MGILLDGHQDYEDWAEENRGKVRINAGELRYHKATQELLTRAQRVTAGFLHYFLTKIGI